MLKELKDLFFRLLKSSLKKGKMTSKPFSKWPNDRERKNANCKISDAEKGFFVEIGNFKNDFGPFPTIFFSLLVIIKVRCLAKRAKINLMLSLILHIKKVTPH